MKPARIGRKPSFKAVSPKVHLPRVGMPHVKMPHKPQMTTRRSWGTGLGRRMKGMM